MKNNLNIDDLESFISKIKYFFDMKITDQIDYFVYYLTVKRGAETARAVDVRDCFISLDLAPYSNIPAYFIKNLKSKFIKKEGGYRLNRNLKTSLELNIDEKPLKTKTDKSLRQLSRHIKNIEENEFFREAIDCFEISAYRASIIMVWNLTINHLYEYILKHNLSKFNLVLSKNNDKRIKIKSIVVKDDFSEIPENKFIEFCKSAIIISKDVRKILDSKLDIRNTYAHPSNVKISESKAIEFTEDLINNIILKFKI